MDRKYKYFLIDAINEIYEAAHKSESDKKKSEKNDLLEFSSGKDYGYNEIIKTLNSEADKLQINLDVLTDGSFDSNHKWDLKKFINIASKAVISRGVSMISEIHKKESGKIKPSIYDEGISLAYYEVATTLKRYALIFNIDLKELGLDKIDPDRDLT